MFITLVLLYLVLLIAMLNYAYKYEGGFSTIYVFGVSGFLYFLIIPMEMYFSGKSSCIVNMIVLNFQSSDQISIAILAILSLVGFSAALLATKFFLYSTKFSLQYNKQVVKVNVERSLLNMVLIIAVVLFVFYHDIILNSIISYKDSYTIRYGSPLFSFLFTLVSLGLSVIGLINLKKANFINNLIGSICFLIVFSFGVVFYYKVLILPALCGLGSYFLGRKQIKPFYLICITAMFIPLLLFFLMLFSLYRTEGISINGVKQVTENISFIRSDPAGAMISIVYTLNSKNSFLWGATYAKIPVVFVPKVILPARPLDLSEEFAKKMIQNWQPGQGLSFSPLAEAYMNFGYLGALLQYFIFGLIWASIWNIARKMVFKENLASYNAFYHVIGFSILIMSFRCPFSIMPKLLVMNIAPFLIVLFIANKCRFLTKTEPIYNKLIE